MNTPTAQLERALQICGMIESANNLITALQKDLDAYNNGDKKIRMMLTKSWIEKNLHKYTGIKERLLKHQNSLM